MKNIVSQEWLINNLSNDDLIILDARAELKDSQAGIRAYKKYHIKNAQFVSLEKTMAGKMKTHGGRHPIPDIKDFTEDMKKLGIRDDSIIVIYDNGKLAMASRLWWIFKYFGKNNVFILEGGIKGWLDSNFEVTSELIQNEKSDALKFSKNESMTLDIDDVKAAIDSDNVVIVDARSTARYSGKVEPFEKIAGHIPTAINYPWMDLTDDGKIMSLEEIEKYFADLKQYEEIIVQCGSGVTGTVNYLFMEEIGWNPKLYVGGYSDWVSYEDSIVINENGK